MSDHIKDNERRFEEGKKLIGFHFRGDLARAKYYHANQCLIFAENYGRKVMFYENYITVEPSKSSSATQNIPKTFRSKEEMLGYVAGYNAAKGWY